MSINVGSLPGKLTGYFLVRDRKGKPKFDDIFNIADEYWNVLTTEEQEVILQERKDHGGYPLSGN